MNIEDLKTCYVFDEDGYFEGTHIAQPNPRNPGDWLFPPRSTNVAPAKIPPTCFYKIQDENSQESGWDEIPYPASAQDFLGIEIPHASRTARNELLRTLLRKYVAENPKLWREKQINDQKGSLVAITVEEIPQPTELELLAQKEAEVRSTRDYYLQLTDYLIVSDYPISEADKQQVVTYRQSLRDLPTTAGFPETITWPEPPTVAKAAHKYWKTCEVNKEIKSKIKSIKAREDLSEEQKTELLDKLQKLPQQSGFPYVIQWPEIPEVATVENDG
ncbi:tail fiber assembly protein [Turicimonas muris]|uniref:tail fiber assembly protein n=1 Tax=Turicimonas muris TaxID=1796652 RepID=UPI0025A58FE3|nr:tail fiber assembly protein [Turicimonas muris]